jgi:hypothetical protein
MQFLGRKFDSAPKPFAGPVQCKISKFKHFEAAPSVAMAQAWKLMQLLVALAPARKMMRRQLQLQPISSALHFAKFKPKKGKNSMQPMRLNFVKLYHYCNPNFNQGSYKQERH